jgi:hypothetical protein
MPNISEGRWFQDIVLERVVKPSTAFEGILTRVLAIVSVRMNINFQSLAVFERKRNYQQEI